MSKFTSWFQYRKVAGKVAIGMVVLSIVLSLAIGLTIYDLQKFHRDVGNLNSNVLPNITTSSELAASLQTTLSNVNKLNYADTNAQRRIVYDEIMLDLEDTKNITAIIQSPNMSIELLLALLNSVEQSVAKLNQLVEQKLDDKEKLNNSIISIIHFNNNLINKHEAVNHSTNAIVNEWEMSISILISKAIRVSQLTRMRELLKLNQESLDVLESMKKAHASSSPTIVAFMVDVEKELYNLLHAEEGIFQLKSNYLSSVARTNGLENQTTLLTEEASVLVSSIFSQTRQSSEIYAAEIHEKLATHTNYLILSSIFVFFSIIGVYLYFQKFLVGRLIGLNKQVLKRVEGEHNQITYDGEDEITDIAKSIKFFMDEIDKQQSKLLEAISQAEKANASKTEFLANISHDIRTPLTGVKGALSLLENTNPDKGQQTLINKAIASSEILHSIINDLLDVSRLEKGLLPLHKDTVDIRSLINDVVNMMEDLKDEKGLKVTTEIDGNIPDLVFIDPKRFTQILFNLLSNALKFTDEGQININLNSHTDSNNNTNLELIIKDTGYGFSKEQMDNAFERFQKFKNKSTHFKESTGLGLSICHYLVKLMEGTIKLESEENKGSTFTITIPYKKVTKKQKTDNKTQSSLGVKKLEKKILVVEDNDINQKLIQMILEADKHTITLVNNGKEAIDMVKKHDYDLILMDVQMPVMNGKEATKHIRNLPEPQCNIPIIALTAHAMDFEADELINIGMNSIVTKPIDTELLETAVQHYSL